MKLTTFGVRFLCLVFLVCAVVAPPAALAQTTKIFVASYGSDVNDGSRGSPKRNFQPAHDTVVAGGQIVVLDTAGYGQLTITKSLAITVPPGVNGFITTTGSNSGITINSATAVVSLRGLIVEGGGGSGGGAGINVTSVSSLRVQDCVVRSFDDGIRVNGSGAARLLVQGSNIRDVGTGIFLDANNGAVLDAIVTGCAVDSATSIGLRAFGSGAGSSAVLTARNCTVTRCQFAGLGASTTSGGSATLYADNCTVSGSTRGVYQSGGSLFTRTNNTFTNNPTEGSFSGTLIAK